MIGSSGSIAFHGSRDETAISDCIRFATVVTDRPGALSALAAVIGEAGANIKHIQHDRGRLGIGVLETMVTVELETRGRAHVPEITTRLRAAGYRVISENG